MVGVVFREVWEVVERFVIGMLEGRGIVCERIWWAKTRGMSQQK